MIEKSRIEYGIEDVKFIRMWKRVRKNTRRTGKRQEKGKRDVDEAEDDDDDIVVVASCRQTEKKEEGGRAWWSEIEASGRSVTNSDRQASNPSRVGGRRRKEVREGFPGADNQGA